MKKKKSRLQDIRAGNTQSEVGMKAMGCFSKEAFILALIAGIYWESWLVFGGVFFGLFIAMYIPVLNRIVALTLSFSWAYLGYEIGSQIDGQNAGFVIGAFAGLSSWGIHSYAMRTLDDLGRDE